ncbi:MAG: GtrA family protein [Pseudomonadota bacterium]
MTSYGFGIGYLRTRLAAVETSTQARYGVSAQRHLGGLAAAGLIALAVDLAVLWSLMALGVPALIARLASIALAMVVSWLINRTVSFAVETPPTSQEFIRFAAVSWAAQAVNYIVFSFVVVVVPAIGATIAVLVGCTVSIFVAYAGFRFAVFGKTTADRESTSSTKNNTASDA